MWTVLTASAPVVLVAMAVGIGIALIQALTQIQEITLTFVPKIVAIMLVVALTGPFIGSQISAFTNVIFERIKTASQALGSALPLMNRREPPSWDAPGWAAETLRRKAHPTGRCRAILLLGHDLF